MRTNSNAFSKLLFLDLETTGLDPKVHGVWQLSAYAEIAGVLKEGFVMNIRPFPQDVIDPDAIKVSGKTKEEILTLKDPVQGYQVLLSFLNKYVNRFDRDDKFTIVAYNSQFDTQFLREFFKKADPENGKFYGAYFTSYSIDVYTITGLMQHLGKFKLPSLKLKSVADHFGIQFEAHQAKDDVKTTRKIYYLCLQELGVIPKGAISE